MASINQQLHRDTLRKGPKAFRAVGERLPDFALLDASGALFESRSLLGSYVVYGFIFTRCTVPSMCPATTRRMAEFQTLLQEAEGPQVQLVLISFDPAFDTPEVLASYADAYGLQQRHTTLLTGDSNAIANLMKQLGVLVYDDAQMIYKHTMQTTLVGPGGKVLYRVPGGHWSPEDFMAKIIASAAGSQASEPQTAPGS
jgi:protein SCO1/2